MTIVSVVSTVSHRYYMKRSKDTIRQRIRELCQALEIAPPTTEEMANESAYQLASRAMKLHAQFPEGT